MPHPHTSPHVRTTRPRARGLVAAAAFAVAAASLLAGTPVRAVSSPAGVAGPSAENDPWYTPRHSAPDARGDVRTYPQGGAVASLASTVDIAALDFYIDTHSGRQGEGKSPSGQYAHVVLGLSGESWGDNHDVGIRFGWKNKTGTPQAATFTETTRTNPQATWQRLSTRTIARNGTITERTEPNQTYTDCGWDLYSTELGGNYSERWWIGYVFPVECLAGVPKTAKLAVSVRRYASAAETAGASMSYVADSAGLSAVRLRGPGVLPRSAVHRANSRWPHDAALTQQSASGTVTFTLSLPEGDSFTSRESLMVAFQSGLEAYNPRQELNFRNREGDWSTATAEHVQYSDSEGSEWDCDAVLTVGDDQRTVTVTLPRTCLSSPVVYVTTSETYQVSRAVHLFGPR